MIKNKEIPIIEPNENGYYAIYDDGRKVWHNEKDFNNNMRFDEYDKAKKEYGIGGGDWMKLMEGENKVRIVSEFEPYGSHYDKDKKKTVACLGKEKCEYCQAGDKPRVQFVGWVIDRKDNQIKLVGVGYTVFQQIGDLQKSDDYAFENIPEYDITIKRVGQDLDTKYTVIPARNNTPLTEDEKEEIDKKVKDPREIIDKMKEKVDQLSGDEYKSEGEEIKADDIPF